MNWLLVWLLLSVGFLVGYIACGLLTANDHVSAREVAELRDWQVKALDWLYKQKAAIVDAEEARKGRSRKKEFHEQAVELESLISRAESRIDKETKNDRT